MAGQPNSRVTSTLVQTRDRCDIAAARLGAGSSRTKRHRPHLRRPNRNRTRSPLCDAAKTFGLPGPVACTRWHRRPLRPKTLATANLITRAASSLLAAWLGIRVISSAIAEPFWAHAAAITAWSIAALNILDLLDPALAFLDGLAFNMGKSTRVRAVGHQGRLHGLSPTLLRPRNLTVGSKPHRPRPQPHAVDSGPPHPSHALCLGRCRVPHFDERRWDRLVDVCG